MISPTSVPLIELAEIVTAAFEEGRHNCHDEDRRGGRLYRAALVNMLKDRFGVKWIAAWELVIRRQSGIAP